MQKKDILLKFKENDGVEITYMSVNQMHANETGDEGPSQISQYSKAVILCNYKPKTFTISKHYLVTLSEKIKTAKIVLGEVNLSLQILL